MSHKSLEFLHPEFDKGLLHGSLTMMRMMTEDFACAEFSLPDSMLICKRLLSTEGHSVTLKSLKQYEQQQNQAWCRLPAALIL